MGKYPLQFNIPLILQGFSVPNHPEYYAKLPDNPRLRVEITSYRDITPGAIHFYATIKADALKLCKMVDGREWNCGGFICKEWEQMPKEITDMFCVGYRIEVVRPVMQEEIDKDPVRWECYRAGDKTPAFETRESATAVAVQIARLRFPGWKIEVEVHC